jgi:hypothetical protein
LDGVINSQRRFSSRSAEIFFSFRLLAQPCILAPADFFRGFSITLAIDLQLIQYLLMFETFSSFYRTMSPGRLIAKQYSQGLAIRHAMDRPRQKLPFTVHRDPCGVQGLLLEQL